LKVIDVNCSNISTKVKLVFTANSVLMEKMEISKLNDDGSVETLGNHFPIINPGQTYEYELPKSIGVGFNALIHISPNQNKSLSPKVYCKNN
jgi:hypothetical protein